MCDCDCDFDGPEFLNESTHKARKPHKCSECHRVVSIGETYSSIFGKWDGTTETFRWCSHCSTAVQIVAANAKCFCPMYGGVKEAILEEAIGAHCRISARLYVGMKRRWAYRRGLRKGQLLPIPLVPVAP